MRALVLAGGLGTRLRPLTDTRPKPLVPFCGEPFAAGLLRRLAAAGCERVTFLVARDPAPYAALTPLAEALGVTVESATEERPLGTAGAVRRLLRPASPDPRSASGASAGTRVASPDPRSASGASAGTPVASPDPRSGRRRRPQVRGSPVHDPVLVCNGDILTDLDLGALLGTHATAGAAATIALTRVEDTSTFGVVVTDGRGRVQRFVEKPPPGTVDADTVNAGTYVLVPGVFADFPGDGPLSFEREVFPALVASGAAVVGHVSAAFWADLGTPARYLAGTAAVLEGRCDWPLAPETRRTETGALVHASADVGGARLGAGSVVGPHCRVGAGATLEASVLFDRVAVGEGAHLTSCILGEGAAVAAGVRLDAAVLADGATTG